MPEVEPGGTVLHGAFPALVTPYGTDGREIDEKGLRSLVEHVINGGVSGVVVCGGSGEFTSLSADERRRLVEVVVEHAAGQITVVAHTGAMTTQEAVEHSEHAATTGVDAVMVGLPYYEPLDLGQIIGYYSAIAERVDLPIMAYNYPVATGVNLGPAVLAELVAAVPSIAYVKDSAGDLGQIQDLATRLAGRVSVFSGSETQSPAGLLMGAAGTVNGVANAFPRAFVDLVAAASDGDGGTLVERWTRLLPYLAFVENHPFASSIKHSLRLLGVPVGTAVRRPADDLPPAAVTELESIIADLT